MKLLKLDLFHLLSRQ